MLTKINILRIISDHYQTLRNNTTNKLSFGDLFLFIFLPSLVAITITLCGEPISSDATNVLITALSVFAGLLFNLLILIFDIVQKQKDMQAQAANSQTGGGVDPAYAIRLKLLNELYTNISFCILLSIVIIFVLLLDRFKLITHFSVVSPPLTFLAYFLLFTFSLTLLMVLKRVYALLKREFQ